MKIYIASFNRASDGALSKLIQCMKEEQLYTNNWVKADYILAVGDRIETLHFIIDRFNENKPIIHLWAGEQSSGTHDETWRRWITEMSMMQLCTNETAKNNLSDQSNALVIGNLMLDNLEVDESIVPDHEYTLVLYNPPTLLNDEEINSEIQEIVDLVGDEVVKWVEPNGDRGSILLYPYYNTFNLSRPEFLALIKHCRRFITNSSCMYFEAPFLMDTKNIIPVGVRNRERESRFSDMGIRGATEKVIALLKGLKNGDNPGSTEKVGLSTGGVVNTAKDYVLDME
jgi:UDP-N-acetylglucosamine 2-epimerase